MQAPGAARAIGEQIYGNRAIGVQIYTAMEQLRATAAMPPKLQDSTIPAHACARQGGGGKLGARRPMNAPGATHTYKDRPTVGLRKSSAGDGSPSTHTRSKYLVCQLTSACTHAHTPYTNTPSHAVAHHAQSERGWPEGAPPIPYWGCRSTGAQSPLPRKILMMRRLGYSHKLQNGSASQAAGGASGGAPASRDAAKARARHQSRRQARAAARHGYGTAAALNKASSSAAAQGLCTASIHAAADVPVHLTPVAECPCTASSPCAAAYPRLGLVPPYSNPLSFSRRLLQFFTRHSPRAAAAEKADGIRVHAAAAVAPAPEGRPLG